MNKIWQTAESVQRYFTVDIWRVQPRTLPWYQALLVKALRVMFLSGQRFLYDECPVRAASMTFFVLLSVVPALAMAFGIAQGFGFQKMLENWLYEQFAGQEQMLGRLIGFSQNLLQNTKGGVIAGIGVALLFWAVIRVLNHIENTFNHIWQVSPRPWLRKFSDYLAIMLIGPVLVISSSSMTVFIAGQVTTIAEKLQVLQVVSPLLTLGFKLLPYVLLWILFTIVYMLMPNQRVNLLSALVAGVVAGTFYQLGQFVYINTQIFVSKYNAIYGSFAALPLFLVWLQVSWMIVLLGAEISFAHQNVDKYEWKPDYDNTSSLLEKQLALQIVHLIVRRFSKAEPAPTADQISDRLQIPVRLARRLLNRLEQSGVLVRIQQSDNSSRAYQPARDIHQIKISSVLEALEKHGNDAMPQKQETVSPEIAEALSQFEEAVRKSEADRLLVQIGSKKS